MNTSSELGPNQQRVTDSFTAKDGARLFIMISDLSKRIEGELQTSRAQIAILNEKIISILETQSRIEAGLSDSRITRLELDLRDAELERDAAEIALRKAEEKLTLKKDVKDASIDTQEKLKNVATSALESVERQKQAARSARWEDLKWSIVKAIAISLSVGFAGAAVAFIWRLVLWSQGNP